MNKYKLKKDTPKHKAGTIFSEHDGMDDALWTGNDFFVFKKSEIENFDEWFELVKTDREIKDDKIKELSEKTGLKIVPPRTEPRATLPPFPVSKPLQVDSIDINKLFPERICGQCGRIQRELGFGIYELCNDPLCPFDSSPIGIAQVYL